MSSGAAPGLQRRLSISQHTPPPGEEAPGRWEREAALVRALDRCAGSADAATPLAASQQHQHRQDGARLVLGAAMALADTPGAAAGRRGRERRARRRDGCRSQGRRSQHVTAQKPGGRSRGRRLAARAQVCLCGGGSQGARHPGPAHTRPPPPPSPRAAAGWMTMRTAAGTWCCSITARTLPLLAPSAWRWCAARAPSGASSTSSPPHQSGAAGRSTTSS